MPSQNPITYTHPKEGEMYPVQKKDNPVISTPIPFMRLTVPATFDAVSQSSTSPKSLIRQAICALLAASATRLKSCKKGVVAGAPPPSPLCPTCCSLMEHLGAVGICSGCDVGAGVDKEPK